MKMKSSAKLRYFISLSLFTFFIFLIPSVFAINKPDDVGRNTAVAQEEGRQQVQNRLTEAKLRVCQAKENSIKKRMEQLVKLATNMQEKFGAIEGRVEEYYTSKVAPSGKTVANDDSLVADIQTKKGAVQTALVKAQSDTGSFACDSDNPKGQLVQFKDDMRAVKSALKDYRTSIKNLIVAIHSVTGTTERNSTASPKPAKTGGENE